ncbi:hypothetical protein Q4555_16200 [Octadecabacter sp. 1_MG-2023]|uniref:hypothetical protein n=1 Tax=unclassified Octadecabacter TaxID=196158 RepID=UPI001C09781B|nr:MULTISPECIES: hypothetical protein [unclassified Octadecabacter]MBU2992072.1 hypothetical protein [Octadecabacter sp. B2R22]MDO6736217.1 hypothetical protein [Octadecabacter sp. 1_MG-2023]
MLKTFLPWYLRWLFKLPWVVYIALAIWVGSLAYSEYENYLFARLEAEIQSSNDAPTATLLSDWTPQDVTSYGEVHIEGLYFSDLPIGQMEVDGNAYSFVLLADDQGEGVKAVLVVEPDALLRLERYLAAQTTGNNISVAINGQLSRNQTWAADVDAGLARMGVPRAAGILVIEPFMGDRRGSIFARADDAMATTATLAGIAAILALIGGLRLFFGKTDAVKHHAAQVKNRKRATTQAQQPNHKPLPTSKPAEASPWGTFKPQDNPMKPAKAPQPNPKATKPDDVVIPAEPAFESVFPGGGSGFRIKTADEIIRQSFGTLSTLSGAKRDNE